MIPDEERLAALTLNELPGFGPRAFQSLLTRYGSAAAAIAAGPSDWTDDAGAPLDRAPAPSDLSAARSRADADHEMAIRHDVRILLSHRGPYPPLLRKISAPPPVLYVQGEDITAERRAIALVGSRACTHYGEKMASKLAEGFVAAGVATVSGLARGIDTVVHRRTLLVGGSTWAVVGSGLLMTYPPENRDLYEEIARKGAVVSEFPMAVKPHPSHFPRRNRIIAGLSAATIVVEGAETSGALITARLAAEEGRDVFAVPGPATSFQSRAPHRLLRDGAGLVESADDVLEELGWGLALTSNDAGPAELADGPVGRLFSNVSDVPIEREELLQRLRIDVATAAPLLLELEMKGLIRALPGGKLVRA